MPNIINIDDKEYDAEQLSDETKAQLISLQFVDAELQRLNAEAAVYQTARVAYANAVNELLADADKKKQGCARFTKFTLKTS